MDIDKCIVNPEKPLDRDGYPRVKFNKRSMSVARHLLTLIYGEAAMEGKVACHTCGNRACVNPNHLYIGSPKDNSDDKWIDGTMAVGSHNGRYRSDVKDSDIWKMYTEEGLSQMAISKATGMAQSQISQRLKRIRKQFEDER